MKLKAYTKLAANLVELRSHRYTDNDIDMEIESKKKVMKATKPNDLVAKSDGMALINERNRKFNLEREKNGVAVKKSFWETFEVPIDCRGGIEGVYDYLYATFK
jgi:hypothetical protein